MKHFHKLRQPEFTQIKALLNMNILPSKLTEVTGRSGFTIGVIRRVNTYQDYRDYIHGIIERSKAKQELMKGQNGTAPHNGEAEQLHITTMTETDKNIVSLLERIANALELMEGHWRPVEQKKKFKIF